jgi:lipase
MSILNPKIRSQSIGDTQIQYLYYGGDGPDLVFLHATGFLPWMWHPIARALSDSYRIIAPYFCDHRHEEPEDGGLNWMLLADDLCALCGGLGLQRPFLVGHSMGATIMTLANAMHGSIAAKMILFEPIFLPENIYSIPMRVEDHPLASKSIKRLNHWDNPVEARNYLRSRKLFKNWDDEMLDIYINYGMVPGESGGLQLACSPRREAALFMGSTHYNPWPLLGKIECPVLVVEGEESENRQFIDLKKAAGLMQKGRYMMISGAGHLIPMEKPSESLSLIRDFLGD